MSNVQVGSCPQCGAPIYSPMAWWGITPPPPIYTCACVRTQYFTITTNGTTIPIDIRDKYPRMFKPSSPGQTPRKVKVRKIPNPNTTCCV